MLGFLWSTGAYGTLVLSEGLFLENVGAHGLILSYCLAAFALSSLSLLLILALHRFSMASLFISTITSVIFSLLAFALFFTFQTETPPFFWYLFKVFGTVIPIALYVSFWAFSDQFFDIQDARRFYALFTATLFLGDAFGGCLIACLIKSIGAQGLLLIFTSSLLFSLPLLRHISYKKTPIEMEKRPQEKKMAFLPLIKTILASPFTLSLMLFYFVMQLLTVTCEFSYMECFDKAFLAHPEKNAITKFLGECSIAISLGNTIVGLFLYSRAVKKFGIYNMIVIAPLFFFILFSLWFNHTFFFLAVAALIGREGMSYTFDDNNLLLLLSGVPGKIKNQVRIMIEAFFEPMAMLGCVLLLLLFKEQSKLLGFFLSFVGVLIVFLLRKHYPKAIISNLTHLHQKKASDWMESFSKGEKKKIESLLIKQKEEVL